jgi:hydroxyacylglutathione hydrolase
MRKWLTKNGIVIIQLISRRSHVFLVTSGTTHILVDTGVKSARKLLEKRLEKLGVKQIDYLVLTHSHYDHAGNAAWVRSRYGARVIIHTEEALFLSSGNILLPRGTLWFTKLPVKLLGKGIAPKLQSEPCRPDILAEERYDLAEAGLNGYILHTPGHSPGSVSLIADNEVALAGDAMFGIFPGSVFPPFGLDERLMVQSWKKLLDTGCSIFLPSHGSANSRALVQKCYDKRKTAPESGSG